VLEHARRVPGLAVTDATHQSGIAGRVSGGWTLEFTYRGHPFAICTNYHAASGSVTTAVARAASVTAGGGNLHRPHRGP
jgi:hypothetical protein